ncbi:gp481 [Bacillus phage G]|uniref:Gp481 n=1 Tax=Bacillus phage G TaxID=2884420 RepID=G3MAM2_9CAUD|nr:gp481 [Bacillus phage G]AEO93739.1 gp481 [Bacillus phage G]
MIFRLLKEFINRRYSEEIKDANDVLEVLDIKVLEFMMIRGEELLIDRHEFKSKGKLLTTIYVIVDISILKRIKMSSTMFIVIDGATGEQVDFDKIEDLLEDIRSWEL